MKICLVNPPWLENGRTGVRAGSRWPHIKNDAERDYLPFPFSLAYAASLLEHKTGYEMKIIDAIASEMSEKRFQETVRRFAPDVVVSEISPPSRENDLRILRAFSGSCRIVLCGPDAEATSDPRFLEKHPFVTATIRGEYEQTLLALLTAWSRNETPEGLGGVHFRHHGRVIASRGSRALCDVDKLPWPHRRTLPMKRYVDAPGGLPLPSAQMWSSRGCPFRCSFCAWPQIMFEPGNYRARAVDDVLNEMAFLSDRLHFKSIYFDDDTFNVNEARVNAFLDRLLERRRRGEIDIPWAVMARADLMTPALLIKFRETGLFSVKYGVESASQPLLDRAGKNMRLEHTLAMIRLTRELGIKVHLTFILGLPGETRESLVKTVNLALSLSPDSLQFSLATPFPGTRLHRELLEKNELVSFSPRDLDGNHCIVIRSPHFSPEELVQAKNDAYLKWNRLQNRIRNPEQIRLGRLHWKKARLFFRQHGLFALWRKSLDYLGFVMRHNREIRHNRFRTIVFSPLRMVLIGGSLRIFHREREVTAGSGLQSSFYCANKRFDTSLCPARVSRLRPNEYAVEFDFASQGLEAVQIFRFCIDSRERITWEAQWFSRKRLLIKDLKYSCMIRPDYRGWSALDHRDSFPEITDWQDLTPGGMEAFEVSVNGANDLPCFDFGFSPGFPAFQVQVQNTGRSQFGRMIHAFSKRRLTLKPGRFPLFHGRLEFH